MRLPSLRWLGTVRISSEREATVNTVLTAGFSHARYANDNCASSIRMGYVATFGLSKAKLF
jgi:hypothetical protein